MILVDPRIGSREFLDAIKVRVGGEAELARPQLEGGDFAFEGNGPDGPVYVGIERKAIGDMLGSMRSGRYAADQARAMGMMFDVCYLIVEGLYRPNEDGLLETPRRVKGKTQWSPFTLAAKGSDHHYGAGSRPFYYSELDKFLQSMESLKNVIVVRSSSKIETVWQIVNRYKWWQKDWDEHNSTDPIKHQSGISYTKMSDLRRFASGLPGIGWEKSGAVDRHFGTIEKAVEALPSEWREVEGIGEKLSVEIYGRIRKRL